jgi:hypothetical protein
VRRIPVAVATLALMASALIAGSPASAVPYEGSETGVLKATPGTFTAGQDVELMANFPSDQASEVITFLKETSPGSGDYSSLGTDAANSLGNAYFEPVTVDAEQEVFARAPDGEVTQLLTLTPTVIVPDSFPVGGSLTMNPATASDGDIVYFLANFPSGTFQVTLYEETSPGTWTSVTSDTTNQYGNAYLHGFEVTGSRKVFALASTGQRTEVETIAPTPEVTLSIQRDCTGNTCDPTATASGGTNPTQEGRSFELQYQSGSSWIRVGNVATTGADGKVEIPFSLAGVTQWTARSYRLRSTSGQALLSNVIKFMPGPTQLGKNVLRVDVEDGVFPTTKGPEYEGVATLSVDGNIAHNRVALEGFGVRGSSTAGYVKKPYKLKFLSKPPTGTSVFGMPRAKNWTLLAGFVDRSLVREKVALDLGGAMGNIAWTPESEYVEMFLNDQYMGAYLMTESVKIDGDRVDIDETQGMIMETDGVSVANSQLGFKSSKGIVFAFKDPDERKDGGNDPTGVTTAKLNAIKTRINAFESKLYSATTRSQYPDFINVPSAIDYYLVKEFTKDFDSDFYRSDYFSWDPSGRVNEPLSDGKFHFGPAWDFDRSAGVNTDTTTAAKYQASPAGFYIRGTGTSSGHPNYTTHWFVQLFKNTAFKNAVSARWDLVKGEFQQATADAQAAADELGPGGTNDRNRWAGESRRYKARASTFQGEVDWVADWYEDRFTWMNGQLD